LANSLLHAARLDGALAGRLAEKTHRKMEIVGQSLFFASGRISLLLMAD
jgi:hypothetical protein